MEYKNRTLIDDGVRKRAWSAEEGRTKKKWTKRIAVFSVLFLILPVFRVIRRGDLLDWIFFGVCLILAAAALVAACCGALNAVSLGKFRQSASCTAEYIFQEEGFTAEEKFTDGKVVRLRASYREIIFVDEYSEMWALQVNTGEEVLFMPVAMDGMTEGTKEGFSAFLKEKLADIALSERNPADSDTPSVPEVWKETGLKNVTPVDAALKINANWKEWKKTVARIACLPLLLAAVISLLLLPEVIRPDGADGWLWSLLGCYAGGVACAAVAAVLAFAARRGKSSDGAESERRYCFSEDGIYMAFSSLKRDVGIASYCPYAAVLSAEEASGFWVLRNECDSYPVLKSGMKEGTEEELTVLLKHKLGIKYSVREEHGR